ncbi:hypothetical protein GWR56_11215 [Mucilaginibacter sp. 14171R-50]|uniref:hypothetical protein n=1 Tax=Mucilaginibacter sp. 14171R-50 TaxID=2703789 RepID=UPI00138DBEB6|nr:hypothetical protein [Mucilaginibacter sp. 14171R-50]QHS56075.1 hypothetical protein GWR56_11215 [Mucilaginibacter sp. 14171R-50]
MKFKVLLLLTLFTAGLTACKKESKNVAASIEGEWHATAYKVATVVNGAEQVSSDTKYDPADPSTHFTFYDNGTGMQHPADPIYANLVSFNYTLENSVLTVKPMFFLVNHNTFTVTKLSDSEITLTIKNNNTDGSHTLQVLSLSK